MGQNRGNFSCYAAGLWTLLIQNGLYKRKLRFSYLTELMKLYNVYDFNYAIRKSALHLDIHIFHFIQIVFLYKREQHINYKYTIYTCLENFSKIHSMANLNVLLFQIDKQ